MLVVYTNVPHWSHYREIYTLNPNVCYCFCSILFSLIIRSLPLNLASRNTACWNFLYQHVTRGAFEKQFDIFSLTKATLTWKAGWQNFLKIFFSTVGGGIKQDWLVGENKKKTIGKPDILLSEMYPERKQYRQRSIVARVCKTVHCNLLYIVGLLYNTYSHLWMQCSTFTVVKKRNFNTLFGKF